MQRLSPVLLLVLASTFGLTATAADFSECAGIKADPVRLACYDRIAQRELAAQSSTPIIVAGDNAALPAKVTPSELPSPVSALSERWELDPESKAGTFQFRAHNATYILPFSTTSSVNTRPSSPAVGRSVPSDTKQRATEVKYQLSFKTKLLENLFEGRSDLWFGYTQESHWQLYNTEASRPFRETDYQPELILTTRTNYDLLGWRGRLVNFGLLHQSNGRSEPLSRSWNRVYAQAGLERGDFVVLVRPWWRVPEREGNDDNPDIQKYIGHGDVVGMWKNGGHVVSVMARKSFESDGKGALQTDWAFPISRNLRGHVQLFTGYGESLIDYNHRQTTLGIGVSLSEGL